MDTISSRESNINYLPWAGVIAGVIGLFFGIFAFAKVSSLKSEIADLKSMTARMDGIETQANQAAAALQAANEAKNSVYNVAKGANDSFKQVSDQLTEVRDRIGKLESARVAVRPQPAPANQGATAQQQQQTPPAAAPGEYVVKSGDTGSKIAAANGVKLADLMAVNPDVNWNRLRVGQKIKLPQK